MRLEVRAILCALGLSGAALLAAGCSPARDVSSPSATAKQDPARAPVEVVKLERREVTRRIDLVGTLMAWEEATLYAKSSGYLAVYSATDLVDYDPPRHQYSDYTVRAMDGSVARQVRTSGCYPDPPQLVPLPPGSYSIEARVESVGMLVVPITLRSGRVAALHLEEGRKPKLPERGVTDLVRLPGGDILGWVEESPVRYVIAYP